MRTKIFPKSRICAIDVYPYVESAIKQSIKFATKHNISLNSADGKKIIISFFINELAENFYKINSSFPKVVFISTKSANSRFKTFITKHITKLLEKTPFYYCGIHEIDSPELEMAASKCLEQQQKTNNKQFIKTAVRLKIKNAKEINFSRA